MWTAFGRAHVILDNLMAEKKIQPMIVVMPNGYAYGRDSGVAADKQQADFQKDLADDLIPFVQANYRARPIGSSARWWVSRAAAVRRSASACGI